MPDRSTNDLISNLRYRSTWVIILEYFLRLRPKADIAALMGDMLEQEQQAVELLAHTLRQADVAPARIGINDELVYQGKLRRTTTARLQFIATGIDNSLVWYQTRLAEPDNPCHDIWQTLHDPQAEMALRFTALLSQSSGSTQFQ
ncbi:MAG: hypothetical protein GY759_03620 [Chloroflexi bacterium]|nr:hypothetical protein [Chloroflexota bacterium]